MLRPIHALVVAPLLVGCHSGMLGIENDGTALPTMNVGQNGTPDPGSLKVVPMPSGDWAATKQKAIAPMCDARSGKAAIADEKVFHDAVAFADDWTKGRAEQENKPKPPPPKGPVTAKLTFDDPHDSGLYVHKTARIECAGDMGKVVLDDHEYAADLVYSYVDPMDQKIKSRAYVALSTKDGSLVMFELSDNLMDPKQPYYDGELVASTVRPYLPQGELAPIVAPSGHQVFVFLVTKADTTAPTPSAFALFGIKVNIGAPDEIRIAKFVVQP